MRISLFAFILLLMTAPGCMMGPRYTKPSCTLPTVYTNTQSALITEQQNLAAWWKHFHDPYLDELIADALEHNYDIRSALQQLEQAQAEYEISAVQLLPEIDLITTVNRTKYSKTLVQESYLKNKTVSYFQTGFFALWEFDVWGKLRHARDARYAAYQADRETVHDVYVMVISQVAQSYVALRALERKIDLVTRMIILVDHLITLTADTHTSGLIDETPYQEYQAQRATLHKQRITLNTEYQCARNQLAILCGRYPEDFIFQTGIRQVPLSLAQLTPGIPSDLVRRRPDIRRAERLLCAATHETGVAITHWFPSFTLFGDGGWQTSQGSQWFARKSLSWSIGPAIDWPLINFGRISFNIKAKKAAQQKALTMYGNTIIKALKEVEDMLIMYCAAHKSIATINDKCQAQMRTYLLCTHRYHSGLENKQACLLAYQDVLEAAYDLAEAEQALSGALIFLYKALGGGWESCTA